MLRKKKNKSLFDARTKAYKEHKTKLEAARIKRESKKSKFAEKVQESISEFNRESFLVEDNLDVLKDIVKRKQNKSIKFKDGSMKVDLFTANALVQVMDKVNADNKAKLTKMINGNKKQFMAAASAVMKMVKMR
jgi:NADP-dependent 3-hydroxy acid dehydrogenase YdfG